MKHRVVLSAYLMSQMAICVKNTNFSYHCT